MSHNDQISPVEPEPEDIAERSEPPLRLGSCILRRPEVATVVQDSLLHFEEERYFLRAWCIMPNHVHVVVKPRGNYTISGILHSWKGFTSSSINRLLKQSGSLWERESFNHLIRRPESVTRFVAYTEANPVKAGLCAAVESWPYSSAGVAFKPMRFEFIDPRSTPFVLPYSRGELKHLHKPGGIYFITWRLLDAVE